MALLTSAESTKMSCKQLKASDNRLQRMLNISINQCMQLLHVLELEKAACQPSALWISSASCNFIGADEYAWWPGVGHEAAANKGHGRQGGAMGGGVPAGSPEWSWNAAWDECHGVGKERWTARESEGVCCRKGCRGLGCEFARKFVSASRSD